MQEAAEAPDGPAESSEGQTQATTSSSDVDIVGDSAEDEEEPAPAASAASEPASAPAAQEPEPETSGESQVEEVELARTASKRRKVMEDSRGGPKSNHHGVSSMQDASGRWRWRVAASADSPEEQTFTLDAGKLAPADRARDSQLLLPSGCANS